MWRCVQFTADAISGLSLLELGGFNSGQPPQVYDWGGGATTVCQVNGEPRQVPDRCFGPTSGPNWSDWVWSNGGWNSRSSGVSGYTVRDGDLEGWTYSNGFGSPPPATTFAHACATAASAPARSATAPRAAAPRATVSPSASQVSAAVPSPTSLASVLPDTAASATPLAVRPGPGGDPAAYLVFGASALLLLGLAGWSLLRRAP